MSPRKYIPIPKELQKKRGRKTSEPIVQPEPPVSETQPEPPVAETQPEQTVPETQPEPPVQNEPEPLEIAQQLAEPPAPEPPKKDIPDELENLLNEYNGQAPETQTSTESHHPHANDAAAVPAVVSPPKVSLVRGYMLLLVLDFVLPTAITLAMRKFGNNRWANLKSKDIRLSDSEFNDLEPIADEVAKDIQLNVSPMTQLMLGMAVIYSSKLMFNEK